MTLRLIPALALSLALHIGIFLPDLVNRLVFAPPPTLRATLRLSPAPAPAEPLLKNTIDSEETPPAAAPARVTPAPATAKAARRDAQKMQRKLAKHLFYPPEAVTRGIEGDVWLLLKLSPDGDIVDVGIATSSGHPILDNAAIRAAYTMGRQAGAASRELIVPAHFRLEP
jgi:periplasmic protein TonB